MSVSTAQPRKSSRPAAASQRPARPHVGRVSTQEYARVASECYPILEGDERALLLAIEEGREPAKFVTPPRRLEVLRCSLAGYQQAYPSRPAARHPEPIPPRPAPAPQPAPQPRPVEPYPSDRDGFKARAQKVQRDLDRMLSDIEERLARLEAGALIARDPVEHQVGGFGHHSYER